ncbi:uncharacterized protein ARMOST_21152 [Armillaria ostoyae]|uniref:Uncharacterized protein n=1 Tax=Armillaria ostoyae TaxID=47428 RepID=A0A284S9A2_ARMOS|nr:uncharacterized protein ARMOST_21152 [Armillaria ostoyae]
MTLVAVDGESTGMPSNESALSAFDADLSDFRLFLDRLVVLVKSAAHRGSKVYPPFKCDGILASGLDGDFGVRSWSFFGHYPFAVMTEPLQSVAIAVVGDGFRISYFHG